MRPNYSVRFDGTTWPHPDDPADVEWRLRYSPDKPFMAAASYVAAYRELVSMPARRRNKIIASLRLAARPVTGDTTEGTQQQ